MDLNITAYQAFLCMLDTAEEKGRTVLGALYSQEGEMIVYANGKEGSGIIGKIEIKKRYVHNRIKTGWFKSKIEVIESFSIHGMVVNPKDKKHFHFSKYTKEVYDFISAHIKELEEKEQLRKEQSLKELLCNQ